MAGLPWEEEYDTASGGGLPWEEDYDAYFDQVEAADANAAEPDYAAGMGPEDFAGAQPSGPDPVEMAQIQADQGVGFQANEPSTVDDLVVNPFLSGQETVKGLLGRAFNQASTNRLSEEDRQYELAGGMQEQYRREAAYAPSEETERQLRAITEAEGPWEAAKALLNNPRGIAYTVSKSMGMYAPALPFIAGAGAAAGGMAAALPAFATSFGLEYQLALDDVMSKRQLDPGSASDVLKVLQDPALMSEVRERGVTRGLAVGTFDALSAGLAGKLLARAGSSMLGRTGAVAGEIGLQAGAGAAGEGLGQLATGDKINWGEIYLEAAAEVPTSLWEVPANYRNAKVSAERNQLNKDLKSALGLDEGPRGAPLTEQGLAGALGMTLPERRPVPTERELIDRAKADAQAILRGESLELPETDLAVPQRLVPGFTAPGNEITVPATEQPPAALVDPTLDRTMDLPAGPFAATQPTEPMIGPAPTELPKPRMRMPAPVMPTPAPTPEQPMALPEGPFAATRMEAPTVGPAPTELPKPRLRPRQDLQETPTPPGPREPPGGPPPAAPAGPGEAAATPAAPAPTTTPPAAEDGAERAAAAPAEAPRATTDRFPIQESAQNRKRRLSAELTELVEVDAQAALEAFEADRGEPLAWNKNRTNHLKTLVGSLVPVDAHPQVSILDGKFDVGDGRHRIALAAERGESIVVAAHPDEAAAIRQRLGAPAGVTTAEKPSVPTPAAPSARPDILTPVSRRGRKAPAAAQPAAPGPASAPAAAAAPATPTSPTAEPAAAPTPKARDLRADIGLGPAEEGPTKTPMVPLSEKARKAIDGLRSRAKLASNERLKEEVRRFGGSTSGSKATLVDRVAAAEEMASLLRTNKIPSRTALRKRIWDNMGTDELSLRLGELADVLYGGKGAATRPLQTTAFVGDTYPGRISPLLDVLGIPERVEGDVESVTGSPSTRPGAAKPAEPAPKASATPSAADAGMADEGAPAKPAAPRAVEQAPAPVEEQDRETLYGKLRGKDVTLQVEVAGREVEITRYAAEALREADTLVTALEEIRETCL